MIKFTITDNKFLIKIKELIKEHYLLSNINELISGKYEIIIQKVSN